MAGHAFVRIAAGEQRTAEGAAQREAGKMIGEARAIYLRAGEVRRAGIRVAILLQGLGAELVAKDPKHIRMRVRLRQRGQMPLLAEAGERARRCK